MKLNIDNKKLKKSLIIGGFSLLILLLAYVGVSFWIQNKLKTELKKVDGLTFSSFQLAWDCNSIKIADLQYVMDSLRSNPTKCKNLKLKGIHWWDYYQRKELIIDEFSLEDANIHLVREEDSTAQKNNNWSALKIGKLQLIDVGFQISRPERWQCTQQKINGTVKGIFLPGGQDSTRFKFESMQIQAAAGEFKKAKGHYTFEWEAFQFDEPTKELTINKLLLKPLHEKSAWSDFFEYKKSRLSASIDSFKVEGLDAQSLFNQRILIADHIELKNGDLDIFVDKNQPPCPDCYKPFIHEQLYNFKLPVDIQKVSLVNQDFFLEILSDKTDEIATLDFKRTYASFYQVSNLDSLLKKGHTITVDTKTIVAKDTEMNVKFEFDLKAPDFPYRYEGSLGQLDLKDLNSLVFNLQKLKIKSGIIKAANFSASGDNELAQGTIAINYEDLAFEIYNKKGTRQKEVLSFLANELGIKENSGSKENAFKNGKMYYLRAKNRSIFHQWANTIKSGFRSVILPNILLSDELEN